MPDSDVLKIKRIVDIKDKLQQTKRIDDLLQRVDQSRHQYLEAFQPRRQRLLEINAIYRNKAYMDKNKAGWQSRTFLPFPYNAVETRTSVLHQALWGNRLGSPYTVNGATPEDHSFADSAEGVLNNTMARIGFFKESARCLRSTVKNGLGVYRHGWTRRIDNVLWREAVRDDKGKVEIDEQGVKKFKYVKRQLKINQPFVRSVEVIDHFGHDPNAVELDKWKCSFAYEIEEMTAEQIKEEENRGNFYEGSFDKLKQIDPHGTRVLHSEDEEKGTQIRNDENVLETVFTPLKDKYQVIHWFGWFDVDGDEVREFIKTSVILDSKLILTAEEYILGEYPFVDVQYTPSLHTMAAWGVLDPVVELAYQINEFTNQRNDGIKLKLNPQFVINVDQLLEDHAYVSSPGAMHPVATDDKPARNAMQVLEFQNLEFLSVNEEERLINIWRETTGNVNVQQAISSLDRTPASTLISLLNEQQAANSLVINSVLDAHGKLGSRVLKSIQLFGDDSFIVRTNGRQGLEFRQEEMENILGDYDVQVTTSTFFGNREIELQQLIQLRPLWAEAPHIDIAEVDRALVQNVLPKMEDRIMKVPEEPLSIVDEQTLFILGQGESVTLSDLEDKASLEQKLKAHQSLKSNESIFSVMSPGAKDEFEIHLKRIENRLKQIEVQEQLQAQEAAAGAPDLEAGQGPQGNLRNTGSPGLRQAAETRRPRTNNI